MSSILLITLFNVVGSVECNGNQQQQLYYQHSMTHVSTIMLLVLILYCCYISNNSHIACVTVLFDTTKVAIELYELAVNH